MRVSLSVADINDRGRASRTDLRPVDDLPFEEFVEQVIHLEPHRMALERVTEAEYKKLKATDFAWLAPFRYSDGRRREDEALDCNLLGIDLDLSDETYEAPDGKTKRRPGLRPDEVEAVCAKLAGLEYVGSTTTGTWLLDDPERVKLRFFLPLSRPVAADEWNRFRKQVAIELDLVEYDDPQTHDLARCFFFTYLFDGASARRHRTFRGSGEAIDVDLVLANAPNEPAAPTPAKPRAVVSLELVVDSVEANDAFRDAVKLAREKALGLRPPGRADDTWKKIGSIAWTLARAARYVSDQQRHTDALREIEVILQKRDPHGYEKELSNLHLSFERGLSEASPLERPFTTASAEVARAVAQMNHGLLFRAKRAKTMRDGWFVWHPEEGVFQEDYGAVTQLIREYAQTWLAKIDPEENEELHEAIVKWVRKLGEPGPIRNVIEELAALGTIAVDEDAFDADPNIINCGNGVLDLRSGHLHEYHPSFMCRKRTSARFLKSASSPVFDDFLHTVTSENVEVASYLMRFFGYAISGQVAEDAFLFLWGEGSNGKSTLLETMTRVLGDYATNLDGDLLTKTRNEKHPTGIARLQGARLASGPEINADAPFDEALLKRLTGRDRVVARRMGQDFFEFDPTHTFVLSGNNFPRVFGTDHGFWRRVRVVQLTQRFTKERGGQHEERMTAMVAERDAIFTKLVHAHQEWIERGLDEPAVVKAWADAYRSESNLVLQWAHECTATGPTESTKSGRSELYQSFVAWAQREGIRHIPTATWFTQQIRKLPGTRLSDSTIVVYGRKQQIVRGLRLLNAGDMKSATAN